MENSLYVGLSRQMVLQTAMSMVSNNVANVDTPGYRAQNPMFEEFIANEKGMKDPLSMVYDRGQYQTTRDGPQRFTGGTYDVAITGPGFIGVTTRTGELQYTRAGNFAVNNAGTLMTANGFTVAGNGGTAITIPANTREVKITDNGDVVADGNAVGQISLYEFDNVQDLKPEGNGLYSGAQGRAAVETFVKQGMLEGSNVQAVTEMTRMIEISREYQSMQRMIQSEHERQRGAIQKLGDVSGS